MLFHSTNISEMYKKFESEYFIYQEELKFIDKLIKHVYEKQE